jgi:hypothetical protein
LLKSRLRSDLTKVFRSAAMFKLFEECSFPYGGGWSALMEWLFG